MQDRTPSVIWATTSLPSSSYPPPPHTHHTPFMTSRGMVPLDWLSPSTRTAQRLPAVHVRKSVACSIQNLMCSSHHEKMTKEKKKKKKKSSSFFLPPPQSHHFVGQIFAGSNSRLNVSTSDRDPFVGAHTMLQSIANTMSWKAPWNSSSSNNSLRHMRATSAGGLRKIGPSPKALKTTFRWPQ